MTTTPNLAEVAVPSGATRVYEFDGEPASRYSVGREWSDGDRIRVCIDGTQYADGGPTHRFSQWRTATSG